MTIFDTEECKTALAQLGYDPNINEHLKFDKPSGCYIEFDRFGNKPTHFNVFLKTTDSQKLQTRDIRSSPVCQKGKDD